MQNKKRLQFFIFWLIQVTWALPTFLIGVLVALFMLFTGHKASCYGLDIYFILDSTDGYGFSIGPFFFITSDCKDSLYMKSHEHGHSIQSLWWGPLTLFVILIPSSIRFHFRDFVFFLKTRALARGQITAEQFLTWKNNRTPYDGIWFERQATNLGRKYFGE